MLQEVLERRLEVHKLFGSVVVLWVVVHRGVVLECEGCDGVD